ncbi:MAG: DUF4294 domain-containing protein [Muribaculaceae bacterium]|nr:DUF4294 domain-containing protein [Muribaculaceae bacterium]
MSITRGVIVFVVAVLSLVASAQPASARAVKKKSTEATEARVMTSDTPIDAIGEYKPQYIRGFNWRFDENGDSIIHFYLRELTVYPAMKFKNKKQEQEYWRTVRDVKLTLPYAKLIAETLIETYEYLETFPTQKEREAYLKQMEGALYKQYKPILRRFSKRQARVLVKLVQRETHQSSYDIVKAFLGAFRAGFWQGFGKLFGVSLKSDFRPEKNEQDATLERIASLVEQGTI